ncbi:MAG: 50S ribosomal protein L3 [Patescibacteria group bacterium]
MKFLLAKKVAMTQVFDEQGLTYPVTVLSATPSTVVAVKEMVKDGYKAAQIGFGEKREKNITKALLGHMKGAKHAHLKEYRLEDGEAINVGDILDVSTFAEGDTVSVTAVSKGKGFQGVVKRHGFKGGRRSHGQKHSEREPGSIGGGGRAGGRVMAGMRMAGRMGGDRVTVKNLKIVKIVPETHEIMIGGAVPGRRGTLVEIKQN